MLRLSTLALGILAASATAQPTAERAGCPYDTCAIWLEDGYFSGEIRRGNTADSERVGIVGLFGEGLIEQVGDLPRARAEAARARGLRIASVVTGAAGTAFSIAAQSVALDETSDGGTVVALTLVSAGLWVYAGSAVLRARRAEARAVYEYNRQFAE